MKKTDEMKLIIEGWRQFLGESVDSTGDYIEDMVSAQKRGEKGEPIGTGFVAKNPTPILSPSWDASAYCWDLSEIIDEIEDVQSDVKLKRKEKTEATKRALRQNFGNFIGEAAITEIALAIGAAFVKAAKVGLAVSAGSLFIAGLAIPLLFYTVRAIRDYRKDMQKHDPDFRWNPSELGKTWPMATMFGIPEEMQKRYPDDLMRSIDEEYEEYLLQTLRAKIDLDANGIISFAERLEVTGKGLDIGDGEPGDGYSTAPELCLYPDDKGVWRSIDDEILDIVSYLERYHNPADPRPRPFAHATPDPDKMIPGRDPIDDPLSDEELSAEDKTLQRHRQQQQGFAQRAQRRE